MKRISSTAEEKGMKRRLTREWSEATRTRARRNIGRAAYQWEEGGVGREKRMMNTERKDGFMASGY